MRDRARCRGTRLRRQLILCCLESRCFPIRRPPSPPRWTTCISSSSRSPRSSRSSSSSWWSFFAIKYRDDTGLKVGAPDHRLGAARDWLVAHPVRHLDGDLRLRHGGLLQHRAAARRDARDLLDRQALDVALPAHRRPERDQRAARAEGPAGAGHVHVRGRAARPLHPGVPREGGRDPGPLQLDLVHGRRRPASSTCSAPSTAAPSTPA